MRDKPHATMEHGHRVIPQYLGLHAQITDPRPNPRTRRGVSPEDDPQRSAWVDEIVKRWKARKD